jgi:hypothetical protein
MAKRRHAHKDLASTTPFPHKGHRVMKGTAETRLKPGKVKRSRSSNFVNSIVRTGLVKGPLKVSGSHKTSRKRTVVKA